MRRPHLLLAASILLALLLGAPGRADAAAALQPAGCAPNRLTNPGFEEGFTARTRTAELVAAGWSAWYETFPGTGGINYAPRYYPIRGDEGAGSVLAGLWSQGLATESSTHIGGLVQHVEVPPKSQILARALVRAWASTGDDPARSDPPGFYTASIGVDPNGGTDWRGPGVVWTRPVTVTDAWTPVVLDTAVEGPRIAVFLRGDAARPLAHNEARWDEACLQVIGAAGEPTAQPTRPPRPTATRDPDEPLPTAGPGTREAEASELLRQMLGTATARANPGAPRIVTAVPTAAAPTPLAGPSGSGPGRYAGIVLLGLGALLGGLLISGARSAGD